MPYALTFLLDAKDLPSSPLDADSETFREFCSQHAPDDDYVAYRYFDPLVMLRRLSVKLGLVGIDYFHQLYAVLDADAMEKAIHDLEAVQRFFREEPAEAAAFLRGSLFSRQIVEAMGQSPRDLEEADPDNLNFYQMLRGVQTNLYQMRNALALGRHFVYVLGDSNQHVTASIQAEGPFDPPYSKEYLLEIERTLERGVDDPSLPFVPPARDSKTESDAAKWLRQMVTLIPHMTTEMRDPYERVARAWYIKGEMRKAAIVSLYSPNLAPEFLDAFALPSMDLLMQESGFNEIDDAAADALVKKLSTVTADESRTFPSSIGEWIGLRYCTGKEWRTWNGTEWVPASDA